MKKLPLLFTTALIGLSFNSFGQVFTTSYSNNNDNRQGDNNVFIGSFAGFSNTTGRENIFTGFLSGFSNTSGESNTYTGHNSGRSNTTGSNNIFTGNSAGFNNTTGDNNIYTGSNAGLENTNGFNNIFTGTDAGRDSSGGAYNIFTGTNAGLNNTTGSLNIFTGYQSGESNTTGSSNVFLGFRSGQFNTTGSENFYVGQQAGQQNTTGSENIIFGRDSGRNNSTGSTNIFMGRAAGGLNIDGSNTVAIGNRAGFRSGATLNGNGGNNNVFIGHYAGQNEFGNSKLYIDDSDQFDLSDADTPLIYGDFEENQLVFHGQVSTGIGNTSFPTTVGDVDVSEYTLFVQGGLLSEEVRINTDWADYVFEDTYKLKSLNEIEDYINTNGHLPNVPSAKEVEASGIEMGEITKIQQEKIEELTLYLIDMDKRLKLIEKENTELREKLINLK